MPRLKHPQDALNEWQIIAENADKSEWYAADWLAGYFSEITHSIALSKRLTDDEKAQELKALKSQFLNDMAEEGNRSRQVCDKWLRVGLDWPPEKRAPYMSDDGRLSISHFRIAGKNEALIQKAFDHVKPGGQPGASTALLSEWIAQEKDKGDPVPAWEKQGHNLIVQCKKFLKLDSPPDQARRAVNSALATLQSAGLERERKN